MATKVEVNILAELEPLTVPISELTLDPKNARQHPDRNIQTLMLSLTHYGQRTPLVANSKTKIVLKGNGLLMAAKELGWDRIAVVWVDDDDETAKAYAIMDNQSGETSEWDLPNLKDILEELDTGAFRMDLTGFLETEIADLMTQLREPGSGLTDDDAVPEVGEQICKPGDLWVLGEHRLLCGDVTMSENVEKLMGGEVGDIVFTDPPYNVNYGSTMKDKMRHKVSKSNAGRKIMNDNFPSKLAYYQFLYQAISAFRPYVKGDVYMCSSSSELHTLQKAFVDSNGHWSTFIIWVKNTFTIGRSNYQRQYEVILYGWFEGSPHYWSGVRSLGDVIKQEQATDVWEFPKPSKSPLHPTTKPVSLVQRAIKNSSRVRGIVLDLFGGSGTTMIACETLDRRCYMMELDPHYCDVIIERWERYTGKEAVLLEATNASG
ncbi:DNA methylase N-4 [Candidatus Pacearchaeota archaeon]|nr:DNA methylase N-4 [Candidatus Pacearchaeota archaeon]|tara:strand:- start:42 stop:1340 length:1299 start_codon:yes stop_codon:yes gene_type:complete